MKFAICNETFGEWPLERTAAFAAECGYRGIEIAPFTLGATAAEIPAAARVTARRAAEAAGLEVTGLHWLLAKTSGLHLASPEVAVRAATADYLGDLARLCRDLGGRVLVLGSPQQRNLLPGVSRAEALDHVTHVLERVVPVLEATEVVLAVEPLSPPYCDFLCSADEAVELIERVAAPAVRLNLDCLAMSAEALPIPEIVRRHHALLVHFHANDPNCRGPGFGELDFVPILAALGEVDYRGWVSVEVFDYDPGPERLARESIDYLYRCLAQIAAE